MGRASYVRPGRASSVDRRSPSAPGHRRRRARTLTPSDPARRAGHRARRGRPGARSSARRLPASPSDRSPPRPLDDGRIRDTDRDAPAVGRSSRAGSDRGRSFGSRLGPGSIAEGRLADRGRGPHGGTHASGGRLGLAARGGRTTGPTDPHARAGGSRSRHRAPRGGLPTRAAAVPRRHHAPALAPRRAGGERRPGGPRAPASRGRAPPDRRRVPAGRGPSSFGPRSGHDRAAPASRPGRARGRARRPRIRAGSPPPAPPIARSRDTPVRCRPHGRRQQRRRARPGAAGGRVALGGPDDRRGNLAPSGFLDRYRGGSRPADLPPLGSSRRGLRRLPRARGAVPRPVGRDSSPRPLDRPRAARLGPPARPAVRRARPSTPPGTPVGDLGTSGREPGLFAPLFAERFGRSRGPRARSRRLPPGGRRDRLDPMSHLPTLSRLPSRTC